MNFLSMNNNNSFNHDNTLEFAKSDVGYCTNTKLYKYHMQHPEFHTLTEIITEYKNESADNFLSACYTKILKIGMEYIIYGIVNEPNSDDEMVICIVAIYANRLDIIDFLLSKNFNLHQTISFNNRHYMFDILTKAISYSNLSTVKYLVENGANPCKNNFCAFDAACLSKSEDVFDFFIDMDMSYQTLCLIFIQCCRLGNGRCNNKNSKLKKIFNKGININDVTENIIESVGIFSVEIVIFFMDNGFDIYHSDKILYNACKATNHELVDFLLGNGLQTNADILGIIFDFMDIKMIEILIKHNINLSDVKPKIHYDIGNQLESIGMTKDVLIDFLMNRNKINFIGNSF